MQINRIERNNAENIIQTFSVINFLIHSYSVEKERASKMMRWI